VPISILQCFWIIGFLKELAKITESRGFKLVLLCVRSAEEHAIEGNKQSRREQQQEKFADNPYYFIELCALGLLGYT
jgi:hypothetical protein